tara:strand:- start:27450 stop:28226 length:777 start_codon:yes stop_codon:yes gene_type:complete
MSELAIHESMMGRQIRLVFRSGNRLYELVQIELKSKIEDQAYELWKLACEATGTEIHGNEKIFWSRAERLVNIEHSDKIRQMAYLNWEAECQKNNSVVHGNDLRHWFQAEYDWLQSQNCRYLYEDTPMHEEHPLKGKNSEFYSNYDKDVANCNDDCISKEGKEYMSSNIKRPEGPGEYESYFDDGEEKEVSYFNQVDITTDEYANKIVITDEDETVVLAVLDSPEELDQLLSNQEFRIKFTQIYGQQAQWVIHNGMHE